MDVLFTLTSSAPVVSGMPWVADQGCRLKPYTTVVDIDTVSYRLFWTFLIYYKTTPDTYIGLSPPPTHTTQINYEVI